MVPAYMCTYPSPTELGFLFFKKKSLEIKSEKKHRLKGCHTLALLQPIELERCAVRVGETAPSTYSQACKNRSGLISSAGKKVEPRSCLSTHCGQLQCGHLKPVPACCRWNGALYPINHRGAFPREPSVSETHLG